MGQKMRILMLLCLGWACIMPLCAQKAAKQQIQNTAMAMVNEVLYYQGADSINDDKKISMTHATFRYYMKSQDMGSREWQANLKNKIVYRILVDQCQGLLYDMNMMMTNARKHPEHMAACITGGTEIMLQAYSVVKHAVVVAMNSQVPLPWKVDYDDFLEGKDNTPNYANDPEKTAQDTDKANLLLPTERFNILNESIKHIIQMRVAVQAVNAKLTVDFTWQKAVEYALKFDNYVDEAHQRVFTVYSNEIKNRPLP